MSPEEKKEAKRLIDSGYRTTSNRYRIVSRIDRKDWRDFMARKHTEGFPGDPQKNFQEGMRWVNALGNAAGDFYRRVYSRDKLELSSEAVYNAVKKAGHGSGWGGLNEFREKIEADPWG